MRALIKWGPPPPLNLCDLTCSVGLRFAIWPCSWNHDSQNGHCWAVYSCITHQLQMFEVNLFEKTNTIMRKQANVQIAKHNPKRRPTSEWPLLFFFSSLLGSNNFMNAQPCDHDHYYHTLFLPNYESEKSNSQKKKQKKTRRKVCKVFDQFCSFGFFFHFFGKFWHKRINCGRPIINNNEWDLPLWG